MRCHTKENCPTCNNRCVVSDCCKGHCKFVDVDVDDRNACTTDVCDPATGIVSLFPVRGCCTRDADCPHIGGPCMVPLCNIASNEPDSLCCIAVALYIFKKERLFSSLL